MNPLHQEYLLELRQESARSLNYYQFDAQSLPTPIETIEFHLLHHCLTTPDGQDVHLALSGRSTDPANLAWLLNTIVLAKYYQNWVDSQVQPAPHVRPGDMLFHKNEILCCTMASEPGTLNVKEAFRKNAQAYNAPIKKGIVLLRKDQYEYQARRTVEQLISYRDHFRQVLNEPRLDVLSRFTHKTLIIGNDDLLVGQPAYPVRYWSRTGTVRAHGLPIDTMIEACGTVETALTHLFTGNVWYDEVIVVGSERYKKPGLLDNLRNEKNLGQFGKLILIGDQQPDMGSQPLKRWRWLARELKQLQGKPLSMFEFNKIGVPDLKTRVDALRQQLNTLQEQAGVDASELLIFLRFYYRLFLPGGPRREAILRDFHNRLELYLRSDELHNKFAVAGHFTLDDVAGRLAPVWEALIDIRDYFLANNPKYTDYLDREGDFGGRRESVVLPSGRYADDVVLRERGNLLIYSGLPNHNLTDLDSWARSAHNNSPHRLYHVPGWLGTNALLQLRHLTGRIIFYLFDGVETSDFTHDWEQMQQYEQRWQQHRDRAYWFTARPPVPEPKPDAQPMPTEPDSPTADTVGTELLESERVYTPLENKAPKYRLSFSDGTAEEFYSYKSLWLLKNGHKVAVTVGELYAGARVQFYQNANIDIFNRIIRQLAGTEKSQLIDTHSQCWRHYCRTLLAHYNHDIDRLYARLNAQGMTCRINNLKAYLQPSSSIRFPLKTTLYALFKLGTAIGLTGDPFITDFKALMASRRWDRNLRHSTGRQLSDELMHFEEKGEKGLLLNQLSDDVVYSLIQSIQEKTIASITLATHELVH